MNIDQSKFMGLINQHMSEEPYMGCGYSNPTCNCQEIDKILIQLKNDGLLVSYRGFLVELPLEVHEALKKFYKDTLEVVNQQGE